LRIIRLKDFGLQVQDLTEAENGLPSEFSSFQKFKLLSAVHLYRPDLLSHESNEYHRSIQKLTWTKLDNKFILDSVWMDTNREADYLTREAPAHISQLLKKVRNVTLGIPYHSVQSLAHVVLPISSSLRSLTIMTDDFPTHDLLRRIPTSVDLLVIAFKAHSCRCHPSFVDRRMFGLLQSRTIKNLRICINSTTRWLSTGENFFSDVSLFMKPDMELFVKTRALCTERGGQFTLNNLLGNSQAPSVRQA